MESNNKLKSLIKSYRNYICLITVLHFGPMFTDIETSWLIYDANQRFTMQINGLVPIWEEKSVKNAYWFSEHH